MPRQSSSGCIRVGRITGLCDKGKGVLKDMDKHEGIYAEIEMLKKCLDKKIDTLDQILSITENQTVLLTEISGRPDAYIESSMFYEMNDQKQLLINEINTNDDIFASVLKRIGPQLDASPEHYGDDIRYLQDRIREVMDLDTKVRVREAKNKDTLVIKRINKPQTPRQDNPAMKREVLERYKSNKK